MQDEEKDERSEKHPREMTSDELLDYSIAPEVAERLKTLVHDGDEESDERD